MYFSPCHFMYVSACHFVYYRACQCSATMSLFFTQCATMWNNVQQCATMSQFFTQVGFALFGQAAITVLYTILYGGNHWTELKPLPLFFHRPKLSANQKTRFIKIKYLCLVLISPVILCSQDVSYLGGSSWPRCGHLCPSISLQVLTFRNAKGG